MATYGKKKRSILPKFSTLRDSTSTSDSSSKKEREKKKEKARKRGSIANSATTSIRDRDSHGQALSPHDDSIEELASMLLEDTEIDQLRTGAGKRLSQTATSKVISGGSTSGYRGNKGLPQLPRLVFNGDDAWALRTGAVVTAAGSSNNISFSAYDNRGPKSDEPDQSQATNHARKDSGPPIPRRSSRRNSVHPQHSLPRQPVPVYNQPVSRKRDGVNKMSQSQQMTGMDAQHISDKVAAMVAATKALKPESGNALLEGPYVPVQKRRLKDSKVLTKVRTAINDHLHGRSLKKRYDPVRDDYLLGNSSANELQSPDDHLSTSPLLSGVERRLNEGDNLKKQKIYNLTGHGIIERKQVAEDGRSLRSRQSASDDPFSERPNSSRYTRTPTSFETRLTEDMSIDPPERIPDLPTREHQADELPCSLSKRSRGSTLVYDTEFDALVSSSPVAQSTPRIRLEPTFEDGKKKLRNVPADTRSLFDPDNSSAAQFSDMDVDTPPTSMGNDHRESDSNTMSYDMKDFSLSAKSRDAKRMKKHPSPSKAELEVLEQSMTGFPRRVERSQTLHNLGDIEDSNTPAAGVLSVRDKNSKLPAPKSREQDDGFGKYLKPTLTRATGTMPDLSKSKIPRLSDTSLGKVRLEPRQERRFRTRDDTGDDHMDIDELQWDRTALMGRRH